MSALELSLVQFKLCDSPQGLWTCFATVEQKARRSSLIKNFQGERPVGRPVVPRTNRRNLSNCQQRLVEVPTPVFRTRGSNVFIPRSLHHPTPQFKFPSKDPQILTGQGPSTGLPSLQSLNRPTPYLNDSYKEHPKLQNSKYSELECLDFDTTQRLNSSTPHPRRRSFDVLTNGGHSFLSKLPRREELPYLEAPLRFLRSQVLSPHLNQSWA